jgi:catechol 2,3-dioxygenase-like lactoylglutathione lyase family enzyme
LRIRGVLETVLYFHDQERAEHFYSGVMGFRLLDREPGRSLFYRAGDSVFLLFHAEATRTGGKLPGHGASGSVHTCFRVAPEDYEPWKRKLAAAGVAVLDELTWERGLSFYFRDSEDNLLEIANADIWPA